MSPGSHCTNNSSGETSSHRTPSNQWTLVIRCQAKRAVEMNKEQFWPVQGLTDSRTLIVSREANLEGHIVTAQYVATTSCKLNIGDGCNYLCEKWSCSWWLRLLKSKEKFPIINQFKQKSVLKICQSCMCKRDASKTPCMALADRGGCTETELCALQYSSTSNTMEILEEYHFKP
jgi:hypothetical protein